MYNKIYDFCGVKNTSSARYNTNEPTPRVQWILKLLDTNSIEYIVDSWSPNNSNWNLWNIILPGNSGKFISAHHDIVNPQSENANDNSASIINAIMTKINSPNTTIAILDGEEIGGLGSGRLSQQINDGKWGKCDWVLNFELTGRGGRHFFIGDYQNSLTDHILTKFNCQKIQTPFNDSQIFNKFGIASTVINPLPALEGKNPPYGNRDVKSPDGTPLDYSIVYKCHSIEDNCEGISPNDMKEFVEEVVLKIID